MNFNKNIKYPFLQAAGVIDLEDANTIISAGFNYIGFPFRLDYHKEDISEVEAKNLIENINTKIEPILITYLSNSIAIKELLDLLNINIIQIHGDIDLKEIINLKQISPETTIIKSLVIKEDNRLDLINYAQSISEYIDAFLTDTFDEKTGAKGATGIAHDWSISEYLSQNLSKPLILAGGLNANNVAEAIRKVKPYGVDSHTGLENSYGRKDYEKCKAFVDNAKAEFDKQKK